MLEFILGLPASRKRQRPRRLQSPGAAMGGPYTSEPLKAPLRMPLSAFFRPFGAALLSLGIWLWPTQAAADALDAIIERGSLRVGIDVGYMPFEMRDKQGRIIGFDVDLAQAMADAMGVQPARGC